MHRVHLRRWAASIERRWDGFQRPRRAHRVPRDLRIVAYRGHGSGSQAVVRGRVLDNAKPPDALVGEGALPALRRSFARFNTRELPGVPLFVRIGASRIDLETDDDGYFDGRLAVDLTDCEGGWARGEVGLSGTYRGLSGPRSSSLEVRVPSSEASFGVISDIDDTILQTGAQRAMTAIRATLTGSALTRTSFAGAAELYGGLAAGRSGPDTNPVFYVSSSPWNLYDFLTGFLGFRRFPAGPLLLRDLLAGEQGHSYHSHKHGRIDEVLELHPDLEFVLIGDSGEEDPEIYAEAVRRHPGRIRAVYIREVRRNPGDGRVERVMDSLTGQVPFVVAGDSAAIADHAAAEGLIDPASVQAVRGAVSQSGRARRA